MKTGKKWYWNSSAGWLDFFTLTVRWWHQWGIFYWIPIYLWREVILFWGCFLMLCWAILLNLVNILLHIFFLLLMYLTQEKDSFLGTIVYLDLRNDLTFLTQRSRMPTSLHRISLKIFFLEMLLLGSSIWVVSTYRQLQNIFKQPELIVCYFFANFFLFKL